jgi:hypothetical protein
MVMKHLSNSFTVLPVSEKFKQGLYKALKNLEDVREDVIAQEQTYFWTQCIRDSTGKWDSYTNIKSKSGSNYFVGSQPFIDYANKQEADYLNANIRIRERLYLDFIDVPEMNIDEFEKWLRELHQKMAYKYVFEGNFPRHVATHTPIVRGVVQSVAEQYNDLYKNGLSEGPHFNNIPAYAFPRDVVNSEGLIDHYYPELEWRSFYLEEARKTLVSIITSPSVGDDEYLENIAYLFQVLINLHLFVNINSSLYMNMVNALLEIAGRKGVEHGILDFVCMRLQPETFSRYFIDQLQ